MRKEGSCLEKEIMQGTIHYMDFPDCLLLLLSISVYARCTQSRKATHGLVDNIKTWTGLPVEESIRMTETNGESTSMVWPALRSRMAKEQNRMEQVSQQ